MKLSRSARSVPALIASILVATALLFVATSQPSAAQEQKACPAGSVLSADGASCLSDAVDDNVVTTTSCTVGVLSEDGQSCIVPRLDSAPAPAAAPAAGDTAEAPVPSFTG